MKAFWDLYASVDQLGDSAESSATATFSVKKFDGTSYVEKYSFTAFDKSSATNPGNTIPSSDTSVGAVGADAFGFIQKDSSAFALDSGQWQLNLLVRTTGAENTTVLVPEPATVSLLGAGLIGLGAARRRKAKAKSEQAV